MYPSSAHDRTLSLTTKIQRRFRIIKQAYIKYEIIISPYPADVLAKFIKKSNGGLAASPKSSAHIGTSLWRLLLSVKDDSDKYVANSQFIKYFERQHLTSCLSNTFIELVENGYSNKTS